MRRLFKGCGFLLVGIVGLVILLIVAAQLVAEARLRRTYDVEAATIVIPDDAASIERGRELVTAGRCRDCHGVNLAGKVSLNEPGIGRVYASNLTSGKGGVGQTYTDADWVRAIRHGVAPDGRSLVVTPAQFYYYLSDEDLGAIVAYLKSLRPVDHEVPQPSVGPLGRLFLTLFNPQDWLPAEKIDHTAPRPPTPVPGVTAEYGKYLAQTATCLVCHGRGGYDPDISAAPGGGINDWTEEEFLSAMRTGWTPDGHRWDDSYMPWRSTSEMSDDDLRALWRYLQTLPPGKAVER
jgi:cytochrome c553